MEDFWSLNESVFYCLYDPKRAKAFRRAIRNTVRSGDVVVDMGAGSGILSMFAADAGAARVYAVESDRTAAASLRETIKCNGLEDTIVVIDGDATSLDLPEPLDVIVCEMIATALLEELQVPAMNNALRSAKPNCRVVLKEYAIYADLVDSKNVFHGKTYQSARFEFADKPSMRSRPLSMRQLVRRVDFSRIVRDRKVKVRLEYRATSDGRINGLRLSGDTKFDDGSTFQDSVSYSFPMVLPVYPPLDVRKGDLVDVALGYELCGGPRTLRFQVRMR